MDEIKIEDYSYELPEVKIAAYPIDKRDTSKLLIYNDGIIEDNFSNIASHLPENALLFYNNTKVVPARMLFMKDTGAIIEIFCLEPSFPKDYSTSFNSRSECSWKCIVGNIRKWKTGELSLYSEENNILINSLDLRAKLVVKEQNNIVINFSWKTDIAFSEVLELVGKIPIPPYLNRNSEEIDKIRYQTFYAKYNGSVAAPTAGLHFTEDVMEKVKTKGVRTLPLCLHVGAGTFLPVNTKLVNDFVMHSEPFSITRETLNAILNKGSRKIIAVGTTSCRALESIYHIGVQCANSGPDLWVPRPLKQWDPYLEENTYTFEEVINSLIKYMDINLLTELNLRTQIIIVPAYKFKVVDILITNFHQPNSTLLLLISSFIGENWRNVYNYALDNDFRFLSYGDSSILFRKI